jgi:predicted ester cyclase
VSLEDGKLLVRRFLDEVMNAGNTAAISDLCVAGSLFAGGIEGQVMAMRSAFPDMRFTIDEMVAEGNKVAVRVTTRGTNTGPMIGLPGFGRLDSPVPPTGGKAMASAMYFFTVVDGKIASFATELDQIGLLRQLGWTFVPPSRE